MVKQSISRLQDKIDAIRYRYWRERGVITQDAPIRELQCKELDDYTDEIIIREQQEKQRGKTR